MQVEDSPGFNTDGRTTEQHLIKGSEVVHLKLLSVNFIIERESMLGMNWMYCYSLLIFRGMHS